MSKIKIAAVVVEKEKWATQLIQIFNQCFQEELPALDDAEEDKKASMAKKMVFGTIENFLDVNLGLKQYELPHCSFNIDDGGNAVYQSFLSFINETLGDNFGKTDNLTNKRKITNSLDLAFDLILRSAAYALKEYEQPNRVQIAKLMKTFVTKVTTAGIFSRFGGGHDQLITDNFDLMLEAIEYRANEITKQRKYIEAFQLLDDELAEVARVTRAQLLVQNFSTKELEARYFDDRYLTANKTVIDLLLTSENFSEKESRNAKNQNSEIAPIQTDSSAYFMEGLALISERVKNKEIRTNKAYKSKASIESLLTLAKQIEADRNVVQSIINFLKYSAWVFIVFKIIGFEDVVKLLTQLNETIRQNKNEHSISEDPTVLHNMRHEIFGTSKNGFLQQARAFKIPMISADVIQGVEAVGSKATTINILAGMGQSLQTLINTQRERGITIIDMDRLHFFLDPLKKSLSLAGVSSKDFTELDLPSMLAVTQSVSAQPTHTRQISPHQVGLIEASRASIDSSCASNDSEEAEAGSPASSSMLQKKKSMKKKAGDAFNHGIQTIASAVSGSSSKEISNKSDKSKSKKKAADLKDDNAKDDSTSETTTSQDADFTATERLRKEFEAAIAEGNLTRTKVFAGQARYVRADTIDERNAVYDAEELLDVQLIAFLSAIFVLEVLISPKENNAKSSAQNDPNNKAKNDLKQKVSLLKDNFDLDEKLLTKLNGYYFLDEPQKQEGDEKFASARKDFFSKLFDKENTPIKMSVKSVLKSLSTYEISNNKSVTSFRALAQEWFDKACMKHARLKVYYDYDLPNSKSATAIESAAADFHKKGRYHVEPRKWKMPMIKQIGALFDAIDATLEEARLRYDTSGPKVEVLLNEIVAPSLDTLQTAYTGFEKAQERLKAAEKACQEKYAEKIKELEADHQRRIGNNESKDLTLYRNGSSLSHPENIAWVDKVMQGLIWQRAGMPGDVYNVMAVLFDSIFDEVMSGKTDHGASFDIVNFLMRTSDFSVETTVVQESEGAKQEKHIHPIFDMVSIFHSFANLLRHIQDEKAKNSQYQHQLTQAGNALGRALNQFLLSMNALLHSVQHQLPNMCEMLPIHLSAGLSEEDAQGINLTEGSYNEAAFDKFKKALLQLFGKPDVSGQDIVTRIFGHTNTSFLSKYENAFHVEVIANFLKFCSRFGEVAPYFLNNMAKLLFELVKDKSLGLVTESAEMLVIDRRGGYLVGKIGRLSAKCEQEAEGRAASDKRAEVSDKRAEVSDKRAEAADKRAEAAELCGKLSTLLSDLNEQDLSASEHIEIKNAVRELLTQHPDLPEKAAALRKTKELGDRLIKRCQAILLQTPAEPVQAGPDESIMQGSASSVSYLGSGGPSAGSASTQVTTGFVVPVQVTVQLPEQIEVAATQAEAPTQKKRSRFLGFK